MTAAAAVVVVRPAGKTLTIYSSLPLQGDGRPQSEDVVRGEQLALEKAGGKAGDFKIKYVSLDDATAATGKWEPGKVSENARKAVGDENTIAYLGEFNSGGSAISAPLLNEAGILQVSPSNTYVGLTRSEGADKGEPQKYQPSGSKTFGRVVPADHIQAAAQVSYMKDQGVKKIYILNDKEVYGKGIADQVEKIAGEQGIEVAGNDGIDTKAANFRGLASKIQGTGADGFFFGGITQSKGVQVFKDVAAANPDIKLFGPDGVAESAFSEKLGSKVEKNTYITNPTLDPKEYPPVGAGLLQGVQVEVRQGPGAVRDLRLRGHGRHARGDQGRRRKGQRPSGRGGRVLQDEGPGVSARHLRHRRERRHHAVRLRWKPDRRRQARLRQGHQGPDGQLGHQVLQRPARRIAGGT